MKNPKISIITVSYNSADTIKDTILSVNNQIFKDIEHIFVDGKSTDNTVNIIKKNSRHMSFLLSEKDDGMYFALNKGIEIAKGEIIGILNSDDKYSDPSVLEIIYDVFRKNTCSIVWGNTLIIKRQNKKIKRDYNGEFDPIKCFEYGIMPPHPSVFIKKEIYNNYGLFNTAYKISADYELLLRFFKQKKVKAKYINKNLVHMQHGGMSSKSLLSNLEVNKQIALINKHFGIATTITKLLFKIIVRITERIQFMHLRKYLLRINMKIDDKYYA